MAKGSSFVGLWYIYYMEEWDQDYIDMEVKAYVEVKENLNGNFQFGLVSGSFYSELETIGDITRLSFSWEGMDECDEVNGRGWLQMAEDDPDELEGLIDIMQGDRSGFNARRAD
ncbi:MAG: hypothetical protein AAGD25_30735 [Cyanobacteria bacterium P01_F01_bin.150]